MKNLVYLVKDFDGRAEEYFTIHDTLEEANETALETWRGYSEQTRVTAYVYVTAIAKEDYLKVKNNQDKYHYEEFSVDIDEVVFNSDFTKGYGDNQETAYCIINAHGYPEEERIYCDLEEAKAKIKELHEKDGKYYCVVEVGKRDAELVFNSLTDIRWWEFVKDFDGVFSTDDL